MRQKHTKHNKSIQNIQQKHTKHTTLPSNLESAGRNKMSARSIYFLHRDAIFALITRNFNNVHPVVRIDT
jgi:hypothetical protein